MARLPVISGAEAIKAFHRTGWRAVRQSGSHVVMIKEAEDATLSIPLHRELKRGLLRKLIRDAGLTVDEFVEEL